MSWLHRVSSFAELIFVVENLLRLCQPLRGVVAVANLYLTRVIPSEYLKVYLLSIGALD